MQSTLGCAFAALGTDQIGVGPRARDAPAPRRATATINPAAAAPR
jgi:hypothetical protein